MERIGMTREGVLRSEAPDGRDPNKRQDVAYYGILREEWADQK
jgi:RimJ/RimL family protein N-acetyltransferase